MIADFGTVVGRTVKGRVVQFFVRNRNTEARTEDAQFVFVQLFLLMGNVLAFASFTKSVALDGFCQDHRRLALCSTAALYAAWTLIGIVPAEAHAGELFVG